MRGLRALTTRACARVRRSDPRAEAGFTLIELMVASALSLAVLATILSILISSQNVQARDNEWALMIQEARTSLTSMAHELRGAYRIRMEGSNHAKLVFDTTINATEWVVEYNCEAVEGSAEYVDEAGTKYKYRECVRKAAQLSLSETSAETTEALAAAKPVPVIRDVLNGTPADEPEGKEDPIFQEFSPNEIAPDLVTIRLVVPAGGTLRLDSAEVYKHHIVLYDGAYVRDMALEA